MKKIKLAITGCMGRMGQQIIESAKSDKDFKLVALTENRKMNISIKSEYQICVINGAKSIQMYISKVTARFRPRNGSRLIMAP